MRGVGKRMKYERAESVECGLDTRTEGAARPQKYHKKPHFKVSSAQGVPHLQPLLTVNNLLDACLCTSSTSAMCILSGIGGPSIRTRAIVVHSFIT